MQQDLPVAVSGQRGRRMDVYIISATRTPLGKFGGRLSGVPAPELGGITLRETLARSGAGPEDVDEVIFGAVLTAGLGQNPARQVLFSAGIPKEVGALTINKVCGSGLKAVMLAAQAIRAGDAHIIAAGGMENMSNAPYLLRKARFGYKYMHDELVDVMVHDGLWDIYTNLPMGITGEIVAERFHITREDADRFALESHMKAAKAWDDGGFDREVVPVHITTPRGEQRLMDRDEGIRRDTTLEKLASLPPAFRIDGVVTAGNSSQISDGASSLLVASEKAVRSHGLKPMARIVGYHTSGVRSDLVMEAPIPAVRTLLKKVRWKIEDVDLFEHNEAFATASVSVMRELGVPPERFNVHGGAVALGHPLGASGARILTTLVHALQQRNEDTGIATLCLGGGNAVVMAVERV